MNKTMQKLCAISVLGLMTSCTSSLTDEANEKYDSKYEKGILDSIQTSNEVETSIGTLKFIDGAPYPETAQKAYDYLDTSRAVDVFLKGMPAASVQGMMKGPASLGAKNSNQMVIFENLMSSKSLYLTGNTSTLYITSALDLKKDGPTVVDVPPGMLGVFNDAWFRYIGDIGPFGADKAKGGKYLLLPPGYKGDIPSGYFIVRSRSYKVFFFMRGSIAKGVDAAVTNAKKTKVYSLAKKANPPKMEFFNATEKWFNTIHANDITFYDHLNEIIQYEPLSLIDVETRGLLASIGIQKGRKFAPDERMKRILKDGVAIANATARSIVWYPRTEGSVDNMKGIKLYPDSDSAWIMAWVDKNVFFNGKDKHTLNSDARVMFHYPYTIVTPAMAVTIPGKGSDYGIAYVDSNKQPFDGSKVYKLHIPANVPAKDFWAVTLYDPQTRSQLQTNQSYPTVGSQSKGFKQNEDGSYDLYFAPEAPKGFEGNWLETIPGKSWFIAFRMYGPLKPWIEKKWRPSEVELVD
ncbi:MAG: DUF1254 domain-containing protein [Lentisphaeraceae bacterium]|nr:DUF1254 domain-containing protein [Lentisphaeraceae bacterium]